MTLNHQSKCVNIPRENSFPMMNHKSELLSIHSSLLVKAICSFSICNRKQKFRRRAKNFWTGRHNRKAVTSLVEEWNKLKIMIFTFLFFRNVNIADRSGKKKFSRENFNINYASKQLCSLHAPVGVFDRNNISRW